MHVIPFSPVLAPQRSARRFCHREWMGLPEIKEQSRGWMSRKYLQKCLSGVVFRDDFRGRFRLGEHFGMEGAEMTTSVNAKTHQHRTNTSEVKGKEMKTARTNRMLKRNYISGDLRGPIWRGSSDNWETEWTKPGHLMTSCPNGRKSCANTCGTFIARSLRARARDRKRKRDGARDHGGWGMREEATTK